MSRLLFVAAFVLAIVPSLARAENWPRFMGANGSGVSPQKGIPTIWSEGNLAWNIELPGEGHSAPIIWEKDLFITSAEDKGVTRHLLCLDAVSGAEKWRRSIGMSESGKHLKSSWASSTPATDGKLVYVAFADQEKYLVSAYDFKGNLVWRRDVGDFESQHNLGVSLMLFEDMLIVPNEQDGPSSMIALDKATGATRWRTLTEIAKVSYSTPIVIPDAAGKPQLICASQAMGIMSLNPHTGDRNWASGPFPLRTVASPVYGNGLLIASCGQGGRYGVSQIAVDATGKLDDKGQPKIVWERKKLIPYVPTPIVYEGHLYEWSDEGIVSCVSLKDGSDVWSKRIGGNYSGSPLCIDGKIYGVSEKGDVVVIKAAPEYELLGTTPLGESSHSTPSVANGRAYFRTFKRLICLPAKS